MRVFMESGFATENACYRVRKALAHEIPLIYELAEQECWNPGECDAEAVAQGMPGAFWLGKLCNQVIASSAATLYGDNIAYLSFYLVKPEYRKQGYGSRLWHTVMKCLEDRNIVLDAMPKQVDFYRRLGFYIDQAFMSYHFDGSIPDCKWEGIPLLPLKDKILEEALIYDQDFFPVKRFPYMKAWLSMPNACGFVWKEGQSISGYGLIRKAKQGYRIGPCYADSPETLLRTLLAQANGAPVSISMPENNPFTQRLVDVFCLLAGSRLQRMYSQFPLELPVERIAAITNFTFG